MPIKDLQADIISRRAPQSAVHRRYYGKGIDVAAIENAVLGANVGRMSDLTDLETESMSIDPHLSGILGKRFGLMDTLPRQYKCATGDDVNKDLAIKYAGQCKRVMERLPLFGQAIYDIAWGAYDGRASSEATWTRAAGEDLKWVPTEVRWIHPRNLNLGPERELRYIDPWQSRGYFGEDGIALRDYPGKFFSWTPRLFREYQEREGLGPRCLYWSFFKRFSWRMRMMLTEIFGIPWRIVKPASPTLNTMAMQANEDQLKAAGAAVEALGGETTAVLGNGLDVEIVQGEGKGELFALTSDQVDAQLSKLVLGQIGTTDGAKAGLNSNTVGVMKGEQEIIHQRDANGISSSFLTELARFILLVNHGEEVASLYTPDVVLDASPNRDRRTEMELLDRAVALSVPVAVAQVREIAQLREPEPGEELVKKPEPPPMAGAPGAPGAPEDGEDGADGEDEEDDDEGTRKGKNLWRSAIDELAR